MTSSYLPCDQSKECENRNRPIVPPYLKVRVGGKTKMLNIQMKVLEPKWKQEQRRSLQNTANKYAKRSSRTFICCLSKELKSRYRILPILKTDESNLQQLPVVARSHIAFFHLLEFVRFSHPRKRKVQIEPFIQMDPNAQKLTIWGNGYRPKHPKTKSENHSSR